MPDFDCYSNLRFAGRVNGAGNEKDALAEGKKRNKDVDEVREVPGGSGTANFLRLSQPFISEI